MKRGERFDFDVAVIGGWNSVRAAIRLRLAGTNLI
jgi:hypothetical protein